MSATVWKKDDHGKTRWHNMPWKALDAVAKVENHGGEKYGPNNWRECPEPSRYLDAAMRHLIAAMQGTELDESGHPHLAHACSSLLFALELGLAKQAKREADLEPFLAPEARGLDFEEPEPSADKFQIHPTLTDRSRFPVVPAEGRRFSSLPEAVAACGLPLSPPREVQFVDDRGRFVGSPGTNPCPHCERYGTRLSSPTPPCNSCSFEVVAGGLLRRTQFTHPEPKRTPRPCQTLNR